MHIFRSRIPGAAHRLHMSKVTDICPKSYQDLEDPPPQIDTRSPSRPAPDHTMILGSIRYPTSHQTRNAQTRNARIKKSPIFDYPDRSPPRRPKGKAPPTTLFRGRQLHPARGQLSRGAGWANQIADRFHLLFGPANDTPADRGIPLHTNNVGFHAS